MATYVVSRPLLAIPPSIFCFTRLAACDPGLCRIADRLPATLAKHILNEIADPPIRNE